MTTSITTIRKDRYSVEEGCDVFTFTPGAHYYGSLTCSHLEHKMLCVKRTAKSVWLANHHDAYITQDGVVHRGECYDLPKRSKIKWDNYYGNTKEYTDAQGWFVTADGIPCGDDINSF